MRILLVFVTFIWFCCGLIYSYQVKDMKAYAIAATGLIGFLTAIANCFTKKMGEKSNPKNKIKRRWSTGWGDFNFNSKKDDN